MKTEPIQDSVMNGLDSIQTNISHLIDRARPVAEDALKQSKKLYKETLDHLPKNSERYIAIAATGLIGLGVGYLLAQEKQSLLEKKVIDSAQEAKKEISPVVESFFAPTLKFMKLWLFYRLSV